MIRLLILSLSCSLVWAADPLPGLKLDAVLQPEAERRISLNLQGMEVRQALHLLAEFSGRNIVVDDDVAGQVTLHLKEVPWNDALDLILASRDLSRSDRGNIIRVSSGDRTRKMESSRALENAFIQLNYLRADQAAAILEGRPIALDASERMGCSAQAAGVGGAAAATATPGATLPAMPLVAATTPAPVQNNRLLSSRGSVTWDSRNNLLIVRDTRKQLDEIRPVLTRLDIPARQVMIESRIVIANTDFSRKLGVRFGARESNGASMVVLPSLLDSASAGASLLAGTKATLQAATGSVTSNDLVWAELQAMERNGEGKVMANPRVLTLNQRPAVIMKGEQIPIKNTTSSTSNSETTTSYKDVLLCLMVEPQILENGEVLLSVEVQKDSARASDASAGSLPIDTQRLKTQVQIGDGETLVLGGIYQEDQSQTHTGLPVLKDIPLLGGLFGAREKETQKRELLVFLTPQLIQREVKSLKKP